MRRYLFASISLISLCANVFAQQSSTEKQPLREGDRVTIVSKIPATPNSFRYTTFGDRSGIACTSAPNSAPPSNGYINCLRLGDLTIESQDVPIRKTLQNYRLAAFGAIGQLGMSDKPEDRFRADAMSLHNAALNSPEEYGTSADGKKTLIYKIYPVIEGNPVRIVGVRSYVAAVFNPDGGAESLQVSGMPNALADRLQFSGLTLGTPKQLVLDTLGFPSSVREVPQIRGKLWDYYPFPFSIELKDDKVYSLRIYRPTPEALGKAFVPLKELPN